MNGPLVGAAFSNEQQDIVAPPGVLPCKALQSHITVQVVWQAWTPAGC